MQSRVAQPASLSPALIKRLKIGVAALVALVVVVAVVAGMSDEDKPAKGESDAVLTMEPDYLDSASKVDPEIVAAHLSEELDRLQEEIDEGRGEGQIEHLKRLQAVWPKHARTNFLLGLAYMEKRYWGDGFKYLELAIQYDAEFRVEPALIKAAIRSLTSQSKPGMGQRFLVKEVGAAAIPYLEETVAGGSKRQRKYAERALKQLQTADL